MRALLSVENMNSQEPVTHACNPSYSGARDQEDCGSNPVQANSALDPITKKGWRSGSRYRP
jgi:hypothetical protein